MTNQENSSQDQGFPRELLSQSIEARLEYFEKKVIAHPFLKTAYDTLLRTIRHPAGSSLIWVYGPTGVGKTTLLKRIVKQLYEEAIKEMERDPGYIPIMSVGLQDISAERVFDWKDYYICLLLALHEPLIDEKIAYDFPLTRLKSLRAARSLPEYRRVAKNCLQNRHLNAVFIDEAQHFKKVASGQRLLDQMDNIKALAETTGIPHVLIGTYGLLDLTNLSGQLSRRSNHIHLPRYHCEKQKDLEAFQNMLMMFQRHLPLPIEPNLVDNYQYFYEGSVGCIGVLKDWLHRALGEALENNAKTLSMKCVKNHEQSFPELMNMVREINEGERSRKSKPTDRAELRRLLGWGKVPVEKQKEKEKGETGAGPDEVKEVPSDSSQSKEVQRKPIPPSPRQGSTARKQRGRVGQRTEKRDPVGYVKAGGD
jgi:DNA transposition AAA+ family ATPase